MSSYQAKFHILRFSVLTEVRMKLLFYWALASCRLIDNPADGDSMFLRNIGICLRVYTAPNSGEQQTSKFFFIIGVKFSHSRRQIFSLLHSKIRCAS
jgi:hypothetical protein